MVALLVLVLAGCWTPRDTGPDSMIGTIHDAAGKPVAGARIETIEARWTSDPEGRFAVNYKEPSQWLEFQHDGVRFRRFYQPADDGKVVDVKLPALGPLRIGCDMDAWCTATLRWKLPDGLVAQVTAPCDRDEPTIVEAAPKTVPDEVTCRPGPAAPDEPGRAASTPDGLLLTPPLVPLRIELVATTKPLPSSCEVLVDDVAVDTTDDGVYRAQVFGFATIKAKCDGIPATPLRIYTRGEARVELTWSRTTPRFEVPVQGPKGNELVVSQIDGLNNGWTLTLPAEPDGTFVLPRLGAGTFVFGIHMKADRVASTRPAAELKPGVLHWRPLDQDVWEGPEPEALGILVLTEELHEGKLPVQVYGSNGP